MLHSLSAQISYYSSYIQRNCEWKFCGVYADEATTGTKDSRPEFQRMIADCKAGKIDMIITKSISQFARNTVTLLETVRMLKELNIDVYFEEQNIHSISGDGELMLTILASFAQEESLSVSENCKWRIRNDFKQGIPNTFSLYGYRWIKGKLHIYEPEADVVRRIHDLYINGTGSVKISHILNNEKTPSPNGGKWSCQTVIGILKSEKNSGDILLQKYYKKDHLNKRLIKNKGELPQYYVEDSHDSIIQKETKEMVNEIFNSKASSIPLHKEDYPFKGIVFCGNCGCRYVRKKNYKKYVWKCNTFCNEGKTKCDSKQVPDSVLRNITDNFDKEIAKFIVLKNNTITIVSKDGIEKDVEVYFEKENIYTLDSKGELLITIMSSLAQEESRSISENVTWGQRKRFADGKINLPYKHFLGYEKGENGYPKIVEKEAKIVKEIYNMFYYQGKTPSNIATSLTQQNIPTPAGKKVWQASTIESILTNEKYKGDALLQKTFTVDFLTKKKKINEGEIQQYYIEGSHPAIISPEFFDLVQIELEKRKGQKRSTAGVFASMLICGDCGNFYGSKVWHSNSKYKRTIWQCNHKFKNKKKCQTPHFTEEQLKDAFVKVFNLTIENRDEIISTVEMAIKTISDTSAIDKKISELQAKTQCSAEQIRSWVSENAHREMNQFEYEREYEKRTENYQALSDDLSKFEKEKILMQNKYKEACVALTILKENKTPITEFDETLFFGLVENVTVKPDKNLIFNFKDGTEIKCEISLITMHLHCSAY